MTRTKSAFLALLAVLLLPMAANAGFIGIGDFGADVQIEEYDNLGLGGFEGSPLDVNGITHIADNGFRYFGNTDAFPNCFDGCLTSNDADGPITILLDGNFGRAGLFVGAAVGFDDTTVSFYSYGGSLIGSVGVSRNTGGDVFVGWESGLGIARIVIDGDPDNGFVTSFDRLHREVPEPGTLALLGIGLLGMGAARRKKA